MTTDTCYCAECNGTAADCHFGDHDYRGGVCRACGDTNYRLMGWYGAVASAAKRWGCTKAEAEQRIIERQMAREGLGR